ncbi:MAG TPA: ATP-binding protein [Acidimicrobiia bacterium]|nr:ATP-binding protein [Acidimicrobiia bacterium]
MPIRLRLGLAFAAVTLVLVVVGGSLFLHSFRSGSVSSLEPGLRAQAAALRQSVREGLTSPDLRGEGGGAIRSHDEVAQVLDDRGRVLATTTEAGSRPIVSRGVLRTALRQPTFTSVAVHDENEPFRLLATPVATSNGARVAVVATSLESINDAVARVRTALLLGGALAVVVAGVGGWWLAGAALRPVERLRREASDISEHDAEAKLIVPGTHDEIAALATTMNGLLEHLHGALRRERAFVADAGHELRTPLSVLRMELELARRPQRTRAELEDAIEHAAAETDRLTGLAEELLLLASSEARWRDAGVCEAVRPQVDRAVAAMRRRAEAQGVRVAVHADVPVSVAVAPELLQRAVGNVLDNALRYSPAGSTITVTLMQRDGDSEIEVVDEGPGFPSAFLPHAFERFRRADDARSRSGGGAGLGLAIVLAIARAHGGGATAENCSPHGAKVTMRFPRTCE